MHDNFGGAFDAIVCMYDQRSRNGLQWNGVRRQCHSCTGVIKLIDDNETFAQSRNAGLHTEGTQVERGKGFAN